MPGSFVPPRWQKPAPLSYGAAIDAVSTVAAPLLAGFSITVIGVIAGTTEKFRWPGIALLLLTMAAMLLVATLQCGFHARQHLYSPADVNSWWPDEDLTEDRKQRIEGEQKRDYETWKNWASKSRSTYNLGIVILAFGIAASLAPKNGPGIQVEFRWAAAALAAAGGMGEIIWTLASSPNARLKRVWNRVHKQTG